MILIACDAGARNHRDSRARHEFERLHPCPSTGRCAGQCPGYIIDHRIALCVGGSDTPDNLRWQTFDASRAKDAWECRKGWPAKLAECERTGCFVE
ncbi:hypothetical protein [Dokdonella soli]